MMDDKSARTTKPTVFGHLRIIITFQPFTLGHFNLNGYKMTKHFLLFIMVAHYNAISV